ncbi:acetyl-coenzyme A transporter 1-like isoform X1 [Metopolophium dirhodum]|uniref:acetyl-coenzyme A transporter 1-like isoform X1 n=2 Tax=Metopolophium dirhodum TaxID=44670 RepID=UPI0029905938|nr:acetyl-coenzyme A transporter 1-like isoform X1 [Metopolophium dirhodum]
MTTSTKLGNKPNKYAVTNISISDKPNLKGDWLNIFILLLLYTLQGLQLGLTSAIPILLQSNKNVSYQDQAVFSLVMWPYTLKLLWAPLVDAIYVKKIGRRKSWLIPVQYIMGSFFLYIANDINNLLPETGKPNIEKLVYVFFVATFLVATQDIVVDGWALTMLKKNNVGYASMCNTTGLAIGSMIGSVWFTLLTSKDFCNKYLRAKPDTEGIVTMEQLLYVWGIVFMFITTLIAIFKNEKDCSLEDDHVKLDTFQNYRLLWDVCKLPSIQTFAIALFTVKVGFAATDSVSPLKLIDAGVSKDDMMIINTSIIAAKIILPLVIARYTSGPKPMSIYLKATLIKLLWNIAFIMLIYYTPKLIKINGAINIPIYYYVILVIILSIQEILNYTMFVALLAFYSKISDPRFGGTYMTLLNTLSNLGNAWSSLTVLGIVDLLTFKECSFDSKNNCSSPDLQKRCITDGGECVVTVNGYYIEMVLCTIFGILWYGIFKNILKNLQMKCPSQWLVNYAKQPITKNVFTVTVT